MGFANLGMRNKQDIMVMKSREALHRICAGGLKARQSSAQGNALCHVWHLSTPQALKGRNPDKPIPPLQGLALVGAFIPQGVALRY
jgi:hypothetical protein